MGCRSLGASSRSPTSRSSCALRPRCGRDAGPDDRRLRRATPREAGRRSRSAAIHRDGARRRLSGGARHRADRARQVRTMAVRIALASMAVTVTAVAVITVGVFVFASSSFERLMVEHGSGVVDARAMFDQSIAGFFVLAAAGCLVGSVLLAILLARWLSRPLRRISGAAQRRAHGERAVRVIAGG